MRSFLSAVILLSLFFSCKSPVKQNEDSVYSRHLQRHVPLTVITTPMPKDKEEMNLLLFIGSKADLENLRVKKIMDSLWKKKLIQPLTIVAFEGKNTDYGLEEVDGPEAKEYKQFNDFVADELYSFIKKKVVIRKFHSVAICGARQSAMSSFDIAWNNDEKIQRAGLFNPSFTEQALNAADKSRKQPHIRILITADPKDENAAYLQSVTFAAKGVEESILSATNHGANSSDDLTNFLLWAFRK